MSEDGEPAAAAARSSETKALPPPAASQTASRTALVRQDGSERKQQPKPAKRRPAPVRSALSMTSQEAPLEARSQALDPLWLGVAVGARLVSLFWLAAALLLWARLVGYADSQLTLQWHAPGGPVLTTLVLALATPVVSVGLWLLASWGAVLWAATVALGIALLVLAPQSLPFGVLELGTNLAAMLVLAALLVVRRKRLHDHDER